MASIRLSLLLLGLSLALLPGISLAAVDELVCPNYNLEDASSLLVDFVNNSTFKPAVPAIFAGVARYNQYTGARYLKATAGYGKRIVGPVVSPASANVATRFDQTRIGSCSKSFVATIVAMLIEAGVLSWDTTLGQCFPDLVLAGTMIPTFQSATLRQLMQMRANVQRDYDPYIDTTFYPTLQKQRQRYARLLLTMSTPLVGNLYSYSNAGYILAAAIAESKTNKTFETMLQEYIVTPMGFGSLAGVGTIGTNTPNAPTQPFGHWSVDKANSGVAYDWANLTKPWLAPPGDVHLTPAQHALWASWHLQYTMGGGSITCSPWAPPCISRANAAELHANAPAIMGDTGSYAMGWWESNNVNQWFGKSIKHNGIYAGWYTIQYASRTSGLAVTVSTNHLRFNWSFPADVVEGVAAKLAAKYALPLCYNESAPFPPSPFPAARRLNNAFNNCSRLAGEDVNRRCVPGALGTTLPSSAATLAACQAECLASTQCLAYAWNTNATAGGSRCSLIAYKYIVLGGRRSLSQTFSLSVYDCAAANGFTSGVIRTSAVGPLMPKYGISGAGLPYNINAAKQVPCSGGGFECMNKCFYDQFGPTACRYYVYNAETRSCYLYGASTTAVIEPWTVNTPRDGCNTLAGSVKTCSF